jgi:RNA polymerase sigma factor (sigma-70 family)
LTLYARQWPGVAEDLVQEAFLALARQSRLPDSPRAWLFQTLRHAAVDAARRASRSRQREQSTSRPESWFTRTDEALDARAACEALALLPLEVREVIVARIWGGLTFQEIARVVRAPLPTVHRRFHAGLNTLRSTLAKEESDVPERG